MSRKQQNQPLKSDVQSFSPTALELEAKPLFKYAYDRYKSQKPRRNKSAFLLFSSEQRALLKSNGENLNSNQMMGKLAELWNTLPPEERRRYDEEAIEEKKRYQKELEAFQKENPSVGKFHNKTKKNHIKKPCSAYGLFLKEVTAEIKKENSGMLMADVLKIVSEKWKSLSDPEKQIYEEQAKREKSLSQAQQLEKITKHVKVEVASTGTTNINDHPSSELYYKQEELSEEQFVPQEAMGNANYGIIVNHLMPTLSSYLASQFDLVLIPKNKNSSFPLPQSQKPLIILPPNFRDLSGESTDAKSLGTTSNDGFRTPSELNIEIPKLHMNPLRREDSNPFNLNQIRLNSNPHFSVNNLGNSVLGGNYVNHVNPVRQDALNNVLMSVINMNQ